jgi:hypothetical protein
MSSKKIRTAAQQNTALHNWRHQRIAKQLNLRRWIRSQLERIAVKAKTTIKDSKKTEYRRLAKK